MQKYNDIHKYTNLWMIILVTFSVYRVPQCADCINQLFVSYLKALDVMKYPLISHQSVIALRSHSLFLLAYLHLATSACPPVHIPLSPSPLDPCGYSQLGKNPLNRCENGDKIRFSTEKDVFLLNNPS